VDVGSYPGADDEREDQGASAPPYTGSSSETALRQDKISGRNADSRLSTCSVSRPPTRLMTHHTPASASGYGLSNHH